MDVEDVATLHIAAALDPETKNARIQAWGHLVYWDNFLSVMRKLRPQHEFIPDFKDTLGVLAIETDQGETAALFKKWTGQDSWRSIEKSISENLASPLFPY